MKKTSKKKKQKAKNVSPSSFKEDDLSSYMKAHTKMKNKASEEECQSTSQLRCLHDEDQSDLSQDSPSLLSTSGDNRVYKKAVYRLGRQSLWQSGERGLRRGALADLSESASLSGSRSSESLPSGPHSSARSSEERRELCKSHTSGESSSSTFSHPESGRKPQRRNLKRRCGSEPESPSPQDQRKGVGDSSRDSSRRQPDTYRTLAFPFGGKKTPEPSASSRDKTPCLEHIRFKIQKKTKLVHVSGVICDRPLSRDESRHIKTSPGASESKWSPYRDRTVAKHPFLGVKDTEKKCAEVGPSPRGARKGSPPHPEVAKRASNPQARKEVHIVLPGTTEAFRNDQETQVEEELHRARTQNELRVSMVERYGALTSMDIDLADEATASSSKEIRQELLIVLDTNILLSHLDFVKKMKSLGLGALGFPMILIPWVVLQELDALKNGKLSQRVAAKAVPAVHYIYTCLKKQEPRLWGQSMQQAAKTAYTLNAENNDDRVLQCCLQYQDLYPEGTLILCTNDKNLCSKAILSGVRALSKEDLVSQAEVLKCDMRVGGSPSPWHPWPAEKAGNRGFETGMKTAAVESYELSTSISVLEDALKEALSKVLVTEMKIAFGDLWEEIVLVKPPWTLSDLLQCFKKHWIAVFGNVFKRNLLHTIECLSDMFCKGSMLDRFAVRRAALETKVLLRTIGHHSDYGGQVSRSLSALEPLLKEPCKPETSAAVNPAIPLASENSDAVMSVEEGSLEIQPSHPEVWEVFENIWSNVCQRSSAIFSALQFDTSSLETGSPESRPPPPEAALSYLCSLAGDVRGLLHGLHRVLVSDCSFEDVQSLFTFICSTEITSMKPRFTAKDLFQCLSQHEYREKLHLGGIQLEDLANKLEGCASSMGYGTTGSSWT